MLLHTYEYITTHVDMTWEKEKILKNREHQFHFAL